MTAINKYLPAVTTTLLGSMLVLFGVNGFLNFMPMPAPKGDAGAFMGGLAAAGYFFPLLKITEIVVGLALLTRRLVPLALTILAPITINIVAFHLFLAPEGLPLALFILVANLGLAFHHAKAFRGILAVSTYATSAGKPSGKASLAAA